MPLRHRRWQTSRAYRGRKPWRRIETRLSGFNDIALLIGRILIGALFLIASYNKFKGLGGSIGYFTKLGVPSPSIAAPVVAAFELAAGILIIVGYWTRFVALAIAVFCVIAALLAHTNFAERQSAQSLSEESSRSPAGALRCSSAGRLLFDGREAALMYSHVTVGASKLTRAMRFYDAALAPLGLKRTRTFKIAASYAPEDFSGVNEPFWVVRPLDQKEASPGNGVTVAFDAPNRAAVDAFHAAALAAGGADEGPPGVREHYHPNYYGAYVRDPDGNKICVVCHQAAAAAAA